MEHVHWTCSLFLFQNSNVTDAISGAGHAHCFSNVNSNVTDAISGAGHAHCFGTVM